MAGAAAHRLCGAAHRRQPDAETARRAVLRCSPLKLPAKLYEFWRQADINFDPESMA